MQSVAVLSEPSQSAQSVFFFNEFERECLEAFDAGVGWDAIEEYFVCVIQRADRGVDESKGTMFSSVHEPLDHKWCTDIAYEWVAELKQRVRSAKDSAKSEAKQEDLLKTEVKLLRQEIQREAAQGFSQQ